MRHTGHRLPNKYLSPSHHRPSNTSHRKSPLNPSGKRVRGTDMDVAIDKESSADHPNQSPVLVKTYNDQLMDEPLLPLHWELFRQESNISFCCCGCCLIGSNFRYLLVTILLTVGPSTAFFVCVSLPQLSWEWTLGLLLWLGLIITVQLLASCIEPGYLPRSVAKPTQTNIGNRRVCRTCKIVRPPRSKHCGVCDACVLKLDHHCPWLGTCIGKRNYRFFVFFVFQINLYAFALSFISFSHLYDRSNRLLTNWQSENVLEVGNAAWHQKTWLEFLGSAIGENPVALVIFLYGLVIGLMLTTLSLFHCKLLCIGETTNEYLNQKWKDTPNPHVQGCFLNYFTPLCETLPHSYVACGWLTDEVRKQAVLRRKIAKFHKSGACV